jgi:2-methylisocitrate lyase-like PEP mutase family enzyme
MATWKRVATKTLLPQIPASMACVHACSVWKTRGSRPITTTLTSAASPTPCWSSSRTLLPGTFNALSARLIADLGFPAIYVTGAGVTNIRLGLPDQGFRGLGDIAEHTARIRDAVELPLLVDADTGFGNALNRYHSVRILERAGADCVQLEDQLSPKCCGHFAGKQVIGSAEMAGKIKAATDARSTHSFDATAERAQRCAEAGADIRFVEALECRHELGQLTQRLPPPQLMNLVVDGNTLILNGNELAALGFAFVLYANAALQGALAGMQTVLSQQREAQEVQADPALLSPFRERQCLVDKPFGDELEQRYRDGETACKRPGCPAESSCLCRQRSCHSR